MKQLDEPQPRYHSHLFTVRVWFEDLGNGQTEWRGRVQDVVSGETHYFREWSMLLAFLLDMLPKDKAKGAYSQDE